MQPIELDIQHQPDEVTCGPTCLQAVYAHYEDRLPIEQVVAEIAQLGEGGTLDVFLANHALARGYRARIYTYNLTIFDPTWFSGGVDIDAKLRAQLRYKPDPKLAYATHGYRNFLKLGGQLRFEDLTVSLLRRYLERGDPILTGLSSTYLYGSRREIPATTEEDDVRGEPAGHFVVLCGFNRSNGKVHIADPWAEHPYGDGHHYEVPIERLISAILLGVTTYDANLLVLEPPDRAFPDAVEGKIDSPATEPPKPVPASAEAP